MEREAAGGPTARWKWAAMWTVLIVVNKLWKSKLWESAQQPALTDWRDSDRAEADLNLGPSALVPAERPQLAQNLTKRNGSWIIAVSFVC